jgi:hypothetical protein
LLAVDLLLEVEGGWDEDEEDEFIEDEEKEVKLTLNLT